MPSQPTLYARMELNIAEAEKRLAKLNKTVDKSMADMERRTARAAKTMENQLAQSASRWAGSVSRGALAAAAAMLSFSAVIAGTKSALDALGDIADKSSQAGLDAEFFQEISFQAEAAGVSMDELSGALNTFNKNSGLAVVNKGKMVQALKALNPELLANIRNAQSQEERVRLVADAIDKERDASRKAAIASAAFGDAGLKLVAVFNGGSSAIDATATRARDLGAIIDRELITSYDDLGDALGEATRVLDTQFKVAVVQLGPVLLTAVGWLASFAKGFNDVIDRWREFNNQRTETLEVEQGTNALKRLEIEGRILDLKRQQADGSISLMDRAQLASDEAEMDRLKKLDAEFTNILNKRAKAAAAAGLANSGQGGDPLTSPPGGRTRNDAAGDAVRQAKAVAELIENLEFERSLVSKSDVDQAKMNALRQAGATATAEQRAQIEALIDATYREKAAHDAVNQSLQDSAELGKDVARTLVDGFRQGASAGELLTNVLDKILSKIIDMQINALFDGSVAGSGGGILGSLFKPLLSVFSPTAAAGGTSVAAASAANAVRPASALRASAAQSIHVTVGIAADGNGNLTPFVESVADRRFARHAPRIVNAAVSKSQASMPRWADDYQKRAG